MGKLNLDIDFRKIRLENGLTIVETLKAEAGRFLQILQEEINRWYASYSPIVYGRTYALLNNLSADDLVTVSADTTHFSISINYNEAHSSLWGSGEVNVLLLMDKGYQVGSDKWFSDIPYFGYRSGGQFLEAALARYNASNILGVMVMANI